MLIVAAGVVLAMMPTPLWAVALSGLAVGLMKAWLDGYL